MATDHHRNFRLRGIPLGNRTRPDVRELIMSVLSIGPGAGVAVHSLAINPVERNSKVATLSFQTLPVSLSERSKDQWKFALPSDGDEDTVNTLILDTHFSGFTPLQHSEEDNCNVDLIAISGLGGDAFSSFKARGGSFMWLRDALALDFPNARILLYGYDTRPVRSSSFQNLMDMGRALQIDMKGIREPSESHPIVFIGHGLGGLLIKMAICKLKEEMDETSASTLNSSGGFLFFGVPHQEMATESLVSLVKGQPSRGLPEFLSKPSALLIRLEHDFNNAIRGRQFDIILIYEREKSHTAVKISRWELSGPSTVLVDVSSATSGSKNQHPIDRSHYEIVKYSDQYDPVYINVRTALQSLFGKAQSMRDAMGAEAGNNSACLFDDPQLKDWMNKLSGGLTWHDGHPGSGKSVLIRLPQEMPVAIPEALDELYSDIQCSVGASESAPFTARTFTDSGYASTKHGMSSKVGSGHATNIPQLEDDHLTRNNNPSNSVTGAETDPMESQESTEEAEVGSIYSETSTIPDEKRERFISELAEELANVVRPYRPTEQAKQRISQLLPEFLRGFALRFGHNASAQTHRDVMVFIHKYRSNVASAFMDLFSETAGGDANRRDGVMSLSERMSLWHSKTDSAMDVTEIVEERQETPEDYEVPDDDADYMDDEHETIESPDLTAYRTMILEAPAFKTLVADLQRECLLVSPESNSMREISQKLLRFLPRHPRISRKRSAETFKMKCTVNWDPIAFLIAQEYTQQPADVIETVITLTGSNKTAQAVPCRQYLSQTWPSTGEQMMVLIKGLIRSGFHIPQSAILPDGTEIVAELQGATGDPSSMLNVKITGTAYSIIETVEQLAWLGAALRSSPVESGVAYCRPVLDCNWVAQGEAEAGWRAGYHCKIDYSMRMEEDDPLPSSGHCWHHLFRSPVVVEGYPIPRRPESPTATGLEIPLNMMAGLAQAHRISTFSGRTVLKGWSTMLVPTEKDDGLVFWHLVHNPDGERISFCECETFPLIQANISALENARHVLGWCSEMKFFGGAADVSYNVEPSRLPETSKDCMLDNAYISSGHGVSGGPPFSIGRKDIPLHVSRHGYIRKLRWIAQKFVILWDEGDKRGWLVNGTSALLHLVRAAMKQASEDDFQPYLVFKPDQLKESPRSHNPTAAINVLMDPHNRKLKIYEDDDILFESQVERFYDLLEKIIDHQHNVVGKSGRNCSNIPRAHLEGWDFHELAAEVDPIHPRLAILEAIGKSWVDFARSIHAVTLFGRGFGEIIKPTEGTCGRWASLPKGRYYLSASISDLKGIINSRGDPDSIPVKLVDNILWHNSGSSFVPCKCKEDGSEMHSDFSQVLLPSSMAHEILQDMSQIGDIKSGGAVIFGQNRELKWFWGDTGEPSRKEEVVIMQQAFPMSPTHDSGIDSGIGKSVASSASKVSDSMAGLRSRQRSVNRSFDDLQGGDACLEDTGALSITSLHKRLQDDVLRNYKVGIVCALYLELMAVRTLFDSEHEGLTYTDEDPNYYALGRIGRHNVVAACLPDGEYGTNSATSVAWNMKRTFTGVKFCLLIGIGGGVPSSQNDIRLGDVVVSRPTGTLGGVLNYELGKALEKGAFQPHGCLPPAPGHLMSALSELRSDPRLSSTPLQPYLEQITSRNPEYRHPGAGQDRLFASDSIHSEHSGRHGSCESCDPLLEMKRPPRLSTHPKIHYGLIASGNKVVRDAKLRDQLANEYNVLCFEMEAAGVMLALPCIVIRGICDYADSHKNKIFQEYAAGAAAAFAKLLLSRVRPSPGQWEDQRADFESTLRHQPPKRAGTTSMAGIEPCSGPKRTRL